MPNNDQIVFVIDLNDLHDGNRVTIARDYTVNYGPRVSTEEVPAPGIGQRVRVHSDDDKTLYWAEVMSKISDRDWEVRIDWETCAPVLNEEWSARDRPEFSTESATRAAGKVGN